MSPAPPLLVTVRALTKRQGTTLAVDAVTLDVAPGEIVGLLGPNGAGKTTTLECLLGLRTPDAGKILLDGIDPRTRPTEALRRVGAQLQPAALQDKITAREALTFFASFYREALQRTPLAGRALPTSPRSPPWSPPGWWRGGDRAAPSRRSHSSIDELITRFALTDKADAPFDSLSSGQRQRLCVALAFVNRPALLVLDEPTTGLDPHARHALHLLLDDHRRDGGGVLLSTHDLDEAQRLCDRIALLHRGRILTTATPAALIARTGAATRIVFQTARPLPVAALALTSFAFLGLGLIIAALADGVPAVQALGQCIFLPMIILGGVGVPLAVLPGWAQQLAGFMPGRYAVAALQSGIDGNTGPVDFGFALFALAVIGAAATAVGVLLFRWDCARPTGARTRLGVACALTAWLIVGATAATTGRLRPLLPPGYAWQEITDTQIATITYENLPGDDDLVTRLAPPLTRPFTSARLAAISTRLSTWSPAQTTNSGQAVRHLVCLAALADLAHDPQEGEIARLVYEHLHHTYPADELIRALAWIVLCPDDGTVVTSAPSFSLHREIDANAVRNRAPLYAQKYLARELGHIRDP